MKPIEERAKAFCEAKICPQCSDHKTCDRRCLTQCIPTDEPYELLVEFASAEHEELTRWNDPKEVPSEFCKDVLVKYRMPRGKVVITAAWRGVGDAGGYSWTICGTNTLINDSAIIGWREIHK